MASRGQKTSGPHISRLINISSGESGLFPTHLPGSPFPHTSSTLFSSQYPRPHSDLEMLWDDFFDTTLGYWTPENGGYGLDGYSLDTTGGEAPSSTILNQSDVFDIGNISTAELEAWWLVFQPDGDLDRRTTTTLIDPCDGQHGDAPEQAESSVPDPSVVSYPAGPCPHPPGTPSSPVPTQSWSGECRS